MLILTRRPGESLHLGDTIRITVLSLQGKQVKIGIDLPPELTVYRGEIYESVKEENRRALETSNEDLLLAANIWHEHKKEKSRPVLDCAVSTSARSCIFREAWLVLRACTSSPCCRFSPRHPC